MSARTVTRLTCDHPQCSGTLEIEGSAFDVRGKPPHGWASSDPTRLMRPVIACPDHARQLRDAERATYDWQVAETEAINAWRKKNPPPKAPKWLERL